MSKFKPPAYVPTEQEHKIAYLSWALDDVYYNDLLRINMYRTGKLTNSSAEEPTKVEAVLVSFDELFDKWRKSGNKEVWELFWPYEEFKTHHTEALADEHCGDCTCVPCPCSRCSAETLYNVPSTVTWCSCEFHGQPKCDKCK
jgi:hypothetical protein